MRLKIIAKRRRGREGPSCNALELGAWVESSAGLRLIAPGGVRKGGKRWLQWLKRYYIAS